jgi:outer membrane protein assembly factor BamB
MKRFLIGLTLSVICIGAALAQTPLETPSFSTFRNNFARTGLYQSPPLLTEPQILWSFDLPRPNRTSIAVADGLAYTGSEAGELIALDVNTGEEVWRFAAEGSIVSTPDVIGGALYVGSLDGSVYRLNAQTGELEWRFETGGQVYASPVLYGDQVFIGSRDGFFYALAQATGELRWRADMDGEVWGSAAVYLPTSTVVIGAHGGEVTSFTYDGEIDWTVEIGGDIHASPVIDAASLYISNSDGAFLSLDSQSGAIFWQVAFQSPIYASPAIGATQLYITDYDGNLVAFDKATGAERWRFDIGAPAYASPSITRQPSDGYEMVYAVSEFGGLMYGIDAETGEEKWRVQTGAQGDWRSSSPVIVDGVLFIGSNTEGVIAYRSADE